MSISTQTTRPMKISPKVAKRNATWDRNRALIAEHMIQQDAVLGQDGILTLVSSFYMRKNPNIELPIDFPELPTRYSVKIGEKILFTSTDYHDASKRFEALR